MSRKAPRKPDSPFKTIEIRAGTKWTPLLETLLIVSLLFLWWVVLGELL